MNNNSASVTIRTPTLPVDWVKVMLGCLLGGLVYYAYFVQTVEPNLTCYTWLVEHWSAVSNYSHGPLIPLIASMLLWWKISNRPSATGRNWRDYWTALASTCVVMVLPDFVKGSTHDSVAKLSMFGVPLLFTWQVWVLRKDLAELVDEPAAIGLPVFVVALVLYYMGVKAGQPRAVVLSFVLLGLGMVLALWGRGVYRMTFFPLVFLVLMIPLNFLEEQVGLPLRHLMAGLSVVLLHVMGIEATRIGTGIYSAVFKFDVAAPCSGIRSLMALTTVTAAYAYVTQESLWKKWALFMSAMPLAVLGNLGRVTLIALVANTYGEKVAMNLHDTVAGFIVFGIALSTMLLIGWALNLPYRRLWQHWTRPVPPKELSHEQQPNTL